MFALKKLIKFKIILESYYLVVLRINYQNKCSRVNFKLYQLKNYESKNY